MKSLWFKIRKKFIRLTVISIIALVSIVVVVCNVLVAGCASG